jgi:hypothetical protein
MRRQFSGLALSVLLLGVGAMPAWACINDREVNTKEREFKSQYQDDQPHYAPEPTSSPSTREQLLSFAAAGAGSAMLMGACVFCFKRK